MKLVAVALALSLGLAVPTFAQEEPVKDEPAKPEAAKPEAAPEEAAKPEAAPEEAAKPEPAKEEAPPAEPAKEEPAKDEAKKPVEEVAPAAAAKPAAEAKPEAAPAKELSPCAKSFSPLADSYKAAYDDMQKWIAQIDAETSAAGAKAKALQDQVQANETAITQAKLAGDDAKAKSLTKENKQLWTDLKAAQQAQQKACGAFSKEAPTRVKQYADASNKALADLKAQAK